MLVDLFKHIDPTELIAIVLWQGIQTFIVIALALLGISRGRQINKLNGTTGEVVQLVSSLFKQTTKIPLQARTELKAYIRELANDIVRVGVRNFRNEDSRTSLRKLDEFWSTYKNDIEQSKMYGEVKDAFANFRSGVSQFLIDVVDGKIATPTLQGNFTDVKSRWRRLFDFLFDAAPLDPEEQKNLENLQITRAKGSNQKFAATLFERILSRQQKGFV